MKLQIIVGLLFASFLSMLFTSCTTSMGDGTVRVSGVAYPALQTAGQPAAVKATAKPVPDEYRQKIDEAISKEKAGDFKQAATLYRQIISEISDVPAPYARLAFTLKGLGYGREASGMFKRFHDLGGDYGIEFVPEFVNNRLSAPVPRTEAEMFNCSSITKGLISEGGNGFYSVDFQQPGDSMPFSSSERCRIGVGSKLRFDRKDWVSLLGVKYRKGGVAVTSSSLSFGEETERLETDGSVSVFKMGNWTK